MIGALLSSTLTLLIVEPDSEAVKARLGISVGAELNDISALCITGDEVCRGADMVIEIDASSYRQTVRPALQSSGWELTAQADTIHGDYRVETFLRVQQRALTGHVTCADRLEASHSVADEDVQIVVRFASCETDQ